MEDVWPSEFVCPISNSVMVDPVIVVSGQTYERACIEAWFKLGQRTCLTQGTPLDHAFVIPNMNLKTAILKMAQSRRLPLPDPPDDETAISLACRFIVDSRHDENEREQNLLPNKRNFKVPELLFTASSSNPFPSTAMERRLQAVDDSRQASDNKAGMAFSQQKFISGPEREENEEMLLQRKVTGSSSNSFHSEAMERRLQAADDSREASDNKVGMAFAQQKFISGSELEENEDRLLQRKVTGSSSNSFPSKAMERRLQAVDDSREDFDNKAGMAFPQQKFISWNEREENEDRLLQRKVTGSSSNSLPFKLREPPDEKAAMPVAQRFIPSAEEEANGLSQRTPDFDNHKVSFEILPVTDDSRELAMERRCLPATCRHSASGGALRQADGRLDKAVPLPLATKPLSAQRQEKGGNETYVNGQTNMKEDIAVHSPSYVMTLTKRLQKMDLLELDRATKELRRLTKESAENRIALCRHELLTALVPHLCSKTTGIQVNAVAAILNMSLEKENKLKIVRAGTIPSLIEVLKNGHPEAQEYCTGTMFSLALNEENKITIGALGVIPPLLEILQLNASGARQDAAMALYQLSLAQSNRSKLVKFGAIPILLHLAQEENHDIASRALLILSSLSAIPGGRTALVEMNGVNIMVGILRSAQKSQSKGSQIVAEIEENAAAVLLLLSQSNLRFKSMAMQAGAMDLLLALSENGTPRAREKASALLAVIRGDIDTSPGLVFSRNPRKYGTRPHESILNSSEF